MLLKNSYYLYFVYCKWSFGNSYKKILIWLLVWFRVCLISFVFIILYKYFGDFDIVWFNRFMIRVFFKYMVRVFSCLFVIVYFILSIIKVFDVY